MTRTLLSGGIAAGPLFLGSVLAQAATRDGYDLGRHPVSLLALGDLGWVQVATFVCAGLLVAGCAVGLRRALTGGRGATWGPRLVGAFGVGLVVAGVFTTDPGAGFPAGAPEGAPDGYSGHAILHEAGFGLAVLSFVAAGVVFARRFAALGRRGWAVASAGVVAAGVVLGAWPDPDGLSVRLLAASALMFALPAAVSALALQDPARDAARASRPAGSPALRREP